VALSLSLCTLEVYICVARTRLLLEIVYRRVFFVFLYIRLVWAIVYLESMTQYHQSPIFRRV